MGRRSIISCGKAKEMMPRCQLLPAEPGKKLQRFRQWGDRTAMAGAVELIRQYPPLIQLGYSVRYIHQVSRQSFREWMAAYLPVRQTKDIPSLVILAGLDREISNPFLRRWAQRMGYQLKELPASKHFILGQEIELQKNLIQYIEHWSSNLH